MPKRVTVVAKKGDDPKKKKSKSSSKKPKGAMLIMDLAPPRGMPGMMPAGPVGRRRRRAY